MKKNRKQVERYRFNGVYGIDSVQCADLQVLIDEHAGKANDPNDFDEKKWVNRWLNRFQRELAKKERTIERKRIEAEKRERENMRNGNAPALRSQAFDTETI